MAQATNSIASDISILNVFTIYNNLEATPEYLENRIKPSGISFNFSNENGYNLDNGRAVFTLYIDCTAINEKDEPIGLTTKIGIETRFQIDNIEKYVVEEVKGEKQIRVELGASLLSIAFSTARGMVLEQTQNTFFQGIILPVINPVDFLLHQESEITDGK